MKKTADDVLNFWAEIGSDGWWQRNDTVDQRIAEEFGETHKLATGSALDDWQQTPDGALALIILLDQFSRNLHRGSAEAFAHDAKSLSIAKTAIAMGLDTKSREDLRVFFYLPFEHCERIAEQEESVKLQHSLGFNPEAMKAALEHREIIQRFGRFPHRNPVLGRHTTPAETAYLEAGGFKG